MMEDSIPSMTLSFHAQKKKKSVLTSYILSIVSTSPLRFKMIASYSILFLSRHDNFFEMSGYYNHFRKSFPAQALSILFLKMIKHTLKSQNISGGLRPPDPTF